jgi:twitching motility protein PilT
MTAALARWLSGAVKAGADEVRLVPGKKVIWVKGGRASENGDAQSADGIEELVESLLTPDARMDLALGCAEWGAEVHGLGTVFVRAELKNGATHAAFFLDGLGPAEPSLPPVLADADEADLAGDAIVDLEDADAGGLVLEVPRAPVHAVSARTAQGAVQVRASAEPAPVARQRAQPAVSAPPPQAVRTPAQPAVAPQPAAVREAAQPREAPAAQVLANAVAPQAAPRNPPQATAAQAPGASAREIHQLLVATLQARGSDLHLSSGVQPMVRIDGEMRPLTIRGPLTSEAIRQMVWPILPERLRNQFVESKDVDFGYELEGYARFRGNLFVDRKGMGAVFRVIPNQIVSADRLGLPPEVMRLCDLPKGLVLVTGPTGSGKSTTLASMIDYVNRSRNGHIITVEDPVEFVFDNKKCLVNQREVGAHTNSFRDALRAALREDPDVLLVGEMRDLETIEIALEMAETGHLVFSTLHTSSAPAAVDRIIDQFPADRQSQIRIMLAESLKGVIAQMLCKRVGGGRVAAFEILMGVPAVSHLIRDKKVFQLPSVMQTGGKLGMRLMNDSLFDLVKRGAVAAEEALSTTQDRAGLLAALKEANIAV